MSSSATDPTLVPWHHFTSPAEKWATQPTFVVGEYLFYACAAIAAYHAWKSGRAHMLLWLCAIVAGTANDLIFMALPLVDNFWQAQATVMITARLPLYIPCVYVCFMYYPTAAVFRVGLPPLARAALTGLVAAVFYAPYDIVGAKFLWWTWHDTDRPIANRLLGAPIGSTMWILTFVAAFSYLFRRVVDKDPGVRPRTALATLALVASSSSLLMVLQMTALQQLDGGVPGIRGLVLLVLADAVIVWRGFASRSSPPIASAKSGVDPSRILYAAVVGYFVTLVLLGALFRPETHRSESVHQTYGPCHVEAKDITGAVRYEFLCAEDYDEDFTFDCAGGPPSDGARWYTVCGRPHRRFATWLSTVAGLGALGALAFGYLLLGSSKKAPLTSPPS